MSNREGEPIEITDLSGIGCEWDIIEPVMRVEPYHDRCPPAWYKNAPATYRAIKRLQWLAWHGFMCNDVPMRSKLKALEKRDDS